PMYSLDCGPHRLSHSGPLTGAAAISGYSFTGYGMLTHRPYFVPGTKRHMAKFQLTFASALYDRMQPIYTGEVQPEGIDLNFIRIEQPRPIFDRMSGGEEFDVAEYSSSEYVQRYANKKCNFVAIPVFPSRCFRHSFIGVNTNKIKKPKELEGTRIGVALYTMTAAIFIRGIPQHDHGVDFSNCTWVQGAINEKGAHGSPTVLPLLKPVKIEQGPPNKSLDDMIQEG